MITRALDKPIARQIDAEAKMSWRSHKLVFHGEPLSVVVAVLNRYFTTKIEIGTSELASKKVVAVIQLAQFDEMLTTFEHSLGVEAEKTPNLVRLHLR